LYKKAGAEIVECAQVWETSHIIVKVRCPGINDTLKKHEAEVIKAEVLIAQIYPSDN
jgi:alanine dehydrogenase